MQSTDSNTVKGKGKDEAEAPQVRDRASILHARDMAQELRERKRSIEQNMRKEEKKLKVKASFDASFWNRLSDIDQKLVEATRLGRKASMLDLGYEEGNPSHERAWQGTEDGRRISEIEVTLQRRLSHLNKQKELFAAPPNPARTLRKAFAQMFIGSARFGMDLPNTLERQKGLQGQFKEELIEVMGRAPSNPIFSENYWCPILEEYVDEGLMRAGHLFPAGATQTTMDAIFGPQEQYMWRDQQKTSQPGVRGELFRACNGIFWSQMAEDRFGKGYFVLVPDLDPNCSKAEARAWQNCRVSLDRVYDRSDVFEKKSLGLSPYAGIVVLYPGSESFIPLLSRLPYNGKTISFHTPFTLEKVRRIPKSGNLCSMWQLVNRGKSRAISCHCFHDYPTSENASTSIPCSLQDDQANSKAGKLAFNVVW
ncbi:MAG: hypothetical protein HETSPECPRED_009935 [Heterodermia speciosa]|uniref:Uncharacterized protein n=1 Tax=Heterodermia speciosa TaxID=116794 RepID=A0A8H3G6W1_9LECA|nr:MAG: hypothetical protein HETSPECPRED_009935 [Heterodermia speciosa]